MTIEELLAGLETHDQGVLKKGAHVAGSREFCALEFGSIMRGKPFSDAPGDLPDLRPLNDGPWSSDAVRTEHLIPVLAALWDWTAWTPARQQQWMETMVLRTVRELIAELPDLSEKDRLACRAAQTLKEAAEAAWAARAAARAAAEAARAAEWAARAEWAAEAAARAAAEAAWAARAAARDRVLARACRIWIEAVPA